MKHTKFPIEEVVQFYIERGMTRREAKKHVKWLVDCGAYRVLSSGLKVFLIPTTQETD